MKCFFRSYQGRHFLSRHARLFFEKPNIRRLLSLGLIFLVFSFGFLVPQTQAYVDTIKSANVTVSEELPVNTTTEVTLASPLKEINISQGFSLFHWGVDLVADEGTPVFAIAKGKVAEVGNAILGYGNYIIIDHQKNRQSLYGHLSKIEVKKGDEVLAGTTIGKVGHTGFATGNHLHLEIHQNGLPVNPLEVLPEK